MESKKITFALRLCETPGHGEVPAVRKNYMFNKQAGALRILIFFSEVKGWLYIFHARLHIIRIKKCIDIMLLDVSSYCRDIVFE